MKNILSFTLFSNIPQNVFLYLKHYNIDIASQVRVDLLGTTYSNLVISIDSGALHLTMNFTISVVHKKFLANSQAFFFIIAFIQSFR